MIDVVKHGLETNASKEKIELANEENEWKKRLEDLASLRKSQKKSSGSRGKKGERLRVSTHQQIATRR